MPSTVKDIFRRNARPTRRRKSTLQEPELEGGVSLQGEYPKVLQHRHSVALTKFVDSMSNMDMMDADLFSYGIPLSRSSSVESTDNLVRLRAVVCKSNIPVLARHGYPETLSRACLYESKGTHPSFLSLDLQTDGSRICLLKWKPVIG
jgi:hypothetical protein